MKTVMQKYQVPKAEIPRSSFDLSHGYKTTFDAGLLIPILAMEALPADTISVNLTAFARLATPIKPVMDNMFMETFFFSVPVRQLWDQWEKFHGEQTNPGDSTDFLVPKLISGGTPAALSLSDYMGIPIGITYTDLDVNSLHFRAYNHIFNNWFRDQNLVPSAALPTDDGPDNVTIYPLQSRRKRPDYFTSCLPWPQKGDAVTTPIGGTADIIGLGVSAGSVGGAGPISVDETSGTRTYDFSTQDAASTFQMEVTSAAGTPQVFADLSSATGVSINDLRQSFQIQKLLERDARGGTRYPEMLKSHFGVTDPQMLVLQRPEFLGGGSSPINISPVAQTTDTLETAAGDTPQGNLAGFGTANLRNHGFTKSFTEHCIILGIVNVRADLTYQQGLERMWSRQTRFDYYYPALSHIGEQAVLNKEIFAQGAAADDDVFGYQERYAEYRYIPSKITGKFRSVDSESLDIWHLSQQFAELPVLGEEFITDKPPIDRVIAVTDEPHFLFDGFFQIRAARALPTYGTPGLIDHF